MTVTGGCYAGKPSRVRCLRTSSPCCGARSPSAMMSQGSMSNGDRQLQEGEDKLRRLVQNLEKSIEQPIASSPQVEECLARIREEGYELSLVLQATLAFAPRGELNQEQVEEVAGIGGGVLASFRMSSLDKKFLRSLKIAVDEEAS